MRHGLAAYSRRHRPARPRRGHPRVRRKLDSARPWASVQATLPNALFQSAGGPFRSGGPNGSRVGLRAASASANKLILSLESFHEAVGAWFRREIGVPTAPQRDGWPRILEGRATLIAAPTGSGKTLAAFLSAIDGLVRDGLSGRLGDEARVLYVSPLKALGNDVHRNLE